MHLSHSPTNAQHDLHVCRKCAKHLGPFVPVTSPDMYKKICQTLSHTSVLLLVWFWCVCVPMPMRVNGKCFVASTHFQARAYSKQSYTHKRGLLRDAEWFSVAKSECVQGALVYMHAFIAADRLRRYIWLVWLYKAFSVGLAKRCNSVWIPTFIWASFACAVLGSWLLLILVFIDIIGIRPIWIEACSWSVSNRVLFLRY